MIARQSKYHNDRFSRSGQLEIGLLIAAAVTRTRCRLRVLKFENPLTVGGETNSQLDISKQVSSERLNRQDGTLKHSLSPNSRTSSLISFLERKSIHRSMSGRFCKNEV